MQSSDAGIRPTSSVQSGGDVGCLVGNGVGGPVGNFVGSGVASGGVNLPSQTSSDHTSLKVESATALLRWYNSYSLKSLLLRREVHVDPQLCA